MGRGDGRERREQVCLARDRQSLAHLRPHPGGHPFAGRSEGKATDHDRARDRKAGQATARTGTFPGQHGQSPFQTIDSGEVADGRELAARRTFDERAPISVAQPLIADRRNHIGVARHLLIGAERAMREPRQRIPPMQRQKAKREGIGEEIAPAMVRHLMRQRHGMLLDIEAHQGIGRERDEPPGEAEGQRAAYMRAGNQPDSPCGRAPYPRSAQHLPAKAAIAHHLPQHERDDAQQPEHRQHKRPGDARQQARRTACRGWRRDLELHHALADKLRQRARWRRDAGQRECLRHQRVDPRHQQAQRRQQPERISDLRAKGVAHRPSQEQHQRHQRAGDDERFDQPGDHDLSAFSNASISAISFSDNCWVSARWATSGVTLPPNSRSTSRCDSCAT